LEGVAVSLARLEEHRRLWDRKVVLREVYRVWFEELLEQARGRVVEIGAGPGLLARFARARRPDLHWVAADLIWAPWNQLSADAAHLPFRAGSVDTVVGLDVIHHLARPLDFLGEAGRILKVGGRLALVEPWVTMLSYPIYRWLHEEGCRPDLDPRRPFAEASGKDAFEGDAAVASRLVDLPPETWSGLGLSPPTARPENTFAYLLSLGFQPRCLLPSRLLRPLLWLDRATSGAASWLGMRALLVWERLA
jgi:SAM-dependent methyltransferase